MVCNRKTTSENTINAPPSLVYKNLTDFDSYSEWNAVIPVVRVEEFKKGSAVRPTFVAPNQKKISFKASFSKIDVDAKTFSWTASMPIPGMFKAEHSFIVVPADDAGTASRLIKTAEYSGLMTPLFGTSIRGVDVGLDEMVRELKLRVEGGGSRGGCSGA